MEKKPAGVSGGLGGLGELENFKVALKLTVAQDVGGFTVGVAAIRAGDESGANDEKASLGKLAEGGLGEGGSGDGVMCVHLVRLVDGANLPRRMISARLFSCGRTIVLQALI